MSFSFNRYFNWHAGDKEIWIRIANRKADLNIQSRSPQFIVWHQLQTDNFPWTVDELMDFVNKPELLFFFKFKFRYDHLVTVQRVSCLVYSFKGIFTHISRLDLRKPSRRRARWTVCQNGFTIDYRWFEIQDSLSACEFENLKTRQFRVNG